MAPTLSSNLLDPPEEVFLDQVPGVAESKKQAWDTAVQELEALIDDDTTHPIDLLRFHNKYRFLGIRRLGRLYLRVYESVLYAAE